LTSFIPLTIILIIGLIPITFHLHYHRCGTEHYFYLELRLLNFSFLRFQIRDRQQDQHFNTEAARGPENQNKADHYLDNLLELCTILKKYGLGGTFFYLFLPIKYRKWVTVTEELERKGRFKRLIWRTVIGGLEPAFLGPTVGLVWSAKGVIIGYLTGEYNFKKKPRIMVVPSFAETSLETMIDSIFEIKLGHIIFTGIRDYLRQLGGGKKHAGTPD
jgi:hypothetical protein